MDPAEKQGDWMRGISGSRRSIDGAGTESKVADDETTRKSQRGKRGAVRPSAGESSVVGNDLRFDSPRSMNFSKRGPVDWTEALRGILFFGILATVLWLEWAAFKAIATYVSTLF